MRKTVITLAAAAFVMIGTGACNRPDPCLQLAPPTPAELATVHGGAEVERVINTGSVERDCELINGRWTSEVEN